MQTGKNAQLVAAAEQMAAALGVNPKQMDGLIPVGRFRATCHAVVPSFINEFRSLRSEMERRLSNKDYSGAHSIRIQLDRMPREIAWVDDYLNLMVTVGKNDNLDKWLSGSAYTAAWYLGLISSVSYGAGVVAADTMASHAGWTEFVGYSNANRPTTAWSAAAAGSKSLSSGAVFNINAAGTVKGSFLVSNNTKNGTTGILATGGTFAGGDQPVVDTNTLTVNYAITLT